MWLQQVKHDQTLSHAIARREIKSVELAEFHKRMNFPTQSSKSLPIHIQSDAVRRLTLSNESKYEKHSDADSRAVDDSFISESEHGNIRRSTLSPVNRQKSYELEI